MFQPILANWRAVTWSAGVLAGAVIVSLILRSILLLLLKRIASGHQTVTVGSLIRHGERLSRWIFPLLALLAALPASDLPERINKPLEHAVGIGLIVVLAWLVILISDVVADVLIARYRMDVANNLLARKVQTQLSVLHRVMAVTVVLVALGAILMTFPSIRSLGTSLLASAGLLGLIWAWPCVLRFRALSPEFRLHSRSPFASTTS